MNALLDGPIMPIIAQRDNVESSFRVALAFEGSIL